MRIAIAADHRGAEMGCTLRDHLTAAGHEVAVVGTLSTDPSDYPDLAEGVGAAIADGSADRGVLICGTGIGAAIAANKVGGVRAALVHDVRTAELSRQHNDANVLCLPGDTLSPTESCAVVDAWLTTRFEGGRHERRVKKIMALEGR